MSFTQAAWDELYREKALNRLATLLEPELATLQQERELDELAEMFPELSKVALSPRAGSKRPEAECRRIWRKVLESPSIKRPDRGMMAKASPRGAASDPAQRSKHSTDRVVVDLIQGRAYHNGVEIDMEKWKRGRLVKR